MKVCVNIATDLTCTRALQKNPVISAETHPRKTYFLLLFLLFIFPWSSPSEISSFVLLQHRWNQFRIAQRWMNGCLWSCEGLISVTWQPALYHQLFVLYQPHINNSLSPPNHQKYVSAKRMTKSICFQNRIQAKVLRMCWFLGSPGLKTPGTLEQVCRKVGLTRLIWRLANWVQLQLLLICFHFDHFGIPAAGPSWTIILTTLW